MDITSFSQQEGETLYEIWERYRELQRRCPYHGLPDWLVVQTFYNGFTYRTKTHVDAAVRGALMGKTAEESQQLIEEMAANNYQWANEQGNTRRTAGMLEVDILNMLSAKMDNVVKMFNRHVGSNSNQGVIIACCTACGGDHDDSMYSSSEQIQYLNNYNRPPQNNPYSNTYNSGWHNHPNFGWKDQGNQQRPINPPNFQPKQPLPESKPAWKMAIEKLANVSNDKIEKLASATTQRFERIEGRMDQPTNMYRNVEIQLGQIANAVNNRNQGDLSNKTEVNPREHVKAITPHSGKEVGEKLVVESEKEFERIENKQLSELGEDGKKIKGKEIKPQIGDTTPIPPPLSFPQRLKFSKNDKEFEKSIRHPMGILENVLIKVQKFIIPVDFVVLDMEEDVNVHIILGRPFLATAGTIIDVKCGKFKFQIREEEVEFDLSKVEKYPSFTDHVYSVDICDELAL
ncbi:uncharacterized protein LOC113769193 [Coffea eugenioides]|uniref:uncharacterized protein LOC113769193 n=1 Tax=Coffea eugenioides TaxID=49369 RepID=UPI000F610560|nr:uncharacterized protein LOC113769193 [Coffea eugenioides]